MSRPKGIARALPERAATRGLPIVASLATLALGGSACTPAGEPRVLPSVDSVDGVEIATLPDLPNMLAEDYAWSVRVLRRMHTQEAGEEPLVFDPWRALELPSGMLLVHDLASDRPLVLLDPERGSVLGRFGKIGQGPGELSHQLGLAEIDGEIVVVDAANQQIHRLDARGGALSSSTFPGDARLSGAVPSPDGRGFLLQAFRTSDGTWYRTLERVDLDSGRASSFLRLPEPAPGAEPGRIQNGRTLWTVVGEHVATMWSSRPVVYVHDAEGRLLREIRLPLTQRSFTERDLQAQAEYTGGRYGSMRLGPAALTNVLYTVNDTTFGMYTTEMWKAAEDPPLEMGPAWWKLFTIRGEYLGTLALPDGFWPLGAGDGVLWARVLDSGGVPVIVELEVVREPVRP